MKIYNTIEFEKLNINPINLSDISHIDSESFELFLYEYDDLNHMQFSDLKYGWLAKTFDERIWILVNSNLAKTFFNMDCDVCIRPDSRTITKLCFLDLDGYKEYFPRYCPARNIEKLDIVKVYETNIYLDMFKKPKDVVDFFEKYKLDEL